MEKSVGEKEKGADNVKEEGYIDKKESIVDKKEEKETEKVELTGNIVKDVEIKELVSKDGKPFKVANFSVAENNNGKAKFTNCLAYNDKAEGMRNLKKGDFVKLEGQEKKTVGKDGREYISIKVLSVKLLKAREQLKEQAKDNSAIGKLNGYKEQIKEQQTEPASKRESTER
ncbi:MAG: single-stranded DNA-binding protein [Peptoanaerobacter stomatis]|uniref:single-stranded DNA-binding protein n=1 Tax=Peptoanaerobacter stomatis TaxID=796937 RepID=UPI003FA08F62